MVLEDKVNSIIKEEIKDNPMLDQIIKRLRRSFIIYTTLASLTLGSIELYFRIQDRWYDKIKNNIEKNIDVQDKIDYNKIDYNKIDIKHENKSTYKKPKVYNQKLKKGITINVKEGESLSSITEKYTGDVHKWKSFIHIDKADNLKIKEDPTLVKPGDRIYIPYEDLLKKYKK